MAGCLREKSEQRGELGAFAATALELDDVFPRDPGILAALLMNRITLAPGLHKDTALKVSWPNRTQPSRVTVDGKVVTDFDDQGLRTTQPFKRLEASW